MTINNVSIGDQFARSNRPDRIYTVVDFHEVKSLTTGEVIKQYCICEHSFMGQVLRTEEKFTSVVMNRITNP